MSIKINDVVFDTIGRPSRVKGIQPQTKAVLLDQDPETVQSTMRYGLINGLSESQRQKRDGALDSAIAETYSEKAKELRQEWQQLINDGANETKILEKRKELDQQLAHDSQLPYGGKGSQFNSVQALYHQIQKLKVQNADSRVIKYLEQDLQHLMAKTGLSPAKLEIDPADLIGTHG